MAQTQVDVLKNYIANLVAENAGLIARNQELEEQVKALTEDAEKKKGLQGIKAA